MSKARLAALTQRCGLDLPSPLKPWLTAYVGPSGSQRKQGHQGCAPEGTEPPILPYSPPPHTPCHLFQLFGSYEANRFPLPQTSPLITDSKQQDQGRRFKSLEPT